MKIFNIKTKFWVSLAFTVLLSTSCNKWLDVQPETDISAEELFSTVEGFEESLNGIYSKCTEADLYGLELTTGTPEAMAQNYTLQSNDPFHYRQTALFNFGDPDLISRKDKVWSGLYNGIVNCNLILEHIDGQKKILAGGKYELIKGEALALRAYLHFDVLRLFAPSYIQGASAKGIPYVTTYSNTVTPVSTVTEVLDKAISDLEQAKQLLHDVDPIRSPSYIVGYPNAPDTSKVSEERSPELFLQNRRHHLNYFAVCGALARIYLYKNDKTKALNNALEVINSNKFPWTSPGDFKALEEEDKDRILYKELVFGWYIPDRISDLRGRFGTGTSGFYIDKAQLQIVYETAGAGATDLRYSQWFLDASSQSASPMEILKYRRNSAGADAPNLHYQMAPAIRLSELYYIAAECTYLSNLSQAIDYLEDVRVARGINQRLNISSAQEFVTELLKECRKEWYAEGQMFFMYKRLNRSIVGQEGSVIPPSNSVFVLPYPNDEIVFGGR